MKIVIQFQAIIFYLCLWIILKTLCQIQAMLRQISDIMKMSGMLEGMRRKCCGLFQDSDLNFSEKCDEGRTPLLIRNYVTAVLSINRLPFVAKT
jgi:gamma-glutamyl:cysteine ligase YbdK (ATP-grasp superfamily)